MNAADILDDRFPHGTVEGFDRGCRTNHCPAPISCTVFRTRYVGDYAFRKLADNGLTAAQIAAHEAEQAAATVAAEKAAKAAERAAQRAPKPVKVKPPKTGRVGGVNAQAWTPDEEATITRMNAAGSLDAQIAAALPGRSPSSVSNKRAALGLTANKRPKVIPHGSNAGYAAGCRDTDCPTNPSCKDAALEYWRETSAARRAGLTITEYRQKGKAE